MTYVIIRLLLLLMGCREKTFSNIESQYLLQR